MDKRLERVDFQVGLSDAMRDNYPAGTGKKFYNAQYENVDDDDIGFWWVGDGGGLNFNWVMISNGGDSEDDLEFFPKQKWIVPYVRRFGRFPPKEVFEEMEKEDD